eukprot:3998469-Pleurochrysis_carterae.AAC.1
MSNWAGLNERRLGLNEQLGECVESGVGRAEEQESRRGRGGERKAQNRHARRRERNAGRG